MKHLNIIKALIFCICVTTLLTAQQKVSDENPSLDDPLLSFTNFPMDSNEEELFICNGTDITEVGHFQGIQSFIKPLQNKRGYFISGDSKRKAYFITITFDPNSNKLGELSNIQLLPSDDRLPPLRHAGGIQLIGDILVIGVEDNQNKCRSQIQFWDVSDPFSPTYMDHLSLYRESNLPKNKTAGAVGIVKRKDDHLLIVANWDSKALDFYKSNKLPLYSDNCRFTFIARWTSESAQKTKWKPDDHWGRYQSLNLVSNRDHNVFMFAFETNGRGNDVIDLYSVDILKDHSVIIEKVYSRRVLFQDGVHFQYASGISINSSGEISSIATERNCNGLTKINISK